MFILLWHIFTRSVPLYIIAAVQYTWNVNCNRASFKDNFVVATTELVHVVVDTTVYVAVDTTGLVYVAVDTTEPAYVVVDTTELVYVVWKVHRHLKLLS